MFVLSVVPVRLLAQPMPLLQLRSEL
jgi:hypothetical protein